MRGGHTGTILAPFVLGYALRTTAFLGSTAILFDLKEQLNYGCSKACCCDSCTGKHCNKDRTKFSIVWYVLSDDLLSIIKILNWYSLKRVLGKFVMRNRIPLLPACVMLTGVLARAEPADCLLFRTQPDLFK